MLSHNSRADVFLFCLQMWIKVSMLSGARLFVVPLELEQTGNELQYNTEFKFACRRPSRMDVCCYRRLRGRRKKSQSFKVNVSEIESMLEKLLIIA
jgi:hypothetical protein